MIREIEVTNLQRIRHKTVTLDKSFNCIFGGNQRGKSALVRGLNWMFTNGPRGDWMRRKDKKGKIHTAIVKITKFDGTVVIRKRGKGNNCYIVDDQKYQDIGKGMPEEVVKALGLSRSFFNKLGINPYVAMQDEPPFLMKVSSTDKAKAINLLTGADLAENAIRDYNKEKLTVGRDIKYNEEQVVSFKETLLKYRPLDELPMEKLERCKSLYVDTCTRIDAVSAILKAIREESETIIRYESLSKVYAVINEACELYPDVVAIEEICDKVQALSDDLDSWKKFKKPVKVDVDLAITQLGLIEDSEAKVEYLSELYDNLKLKREHVIMYNEEMNKNSIKLNNAHINCPKCKTRIPMKGLL